MVAKARSTRVIALASTLALACPVASAAQPALVDPPRLPLSERMRAAVERVEPVAPGLYLIRAEVGSNVTVSAGEDGVLVVDTQFAGMEAKLLGAIRSISGKPIRLVVNTHGHPDHAGANPAFAQEGALIIGQELVLKNMSRGQPDSVNGGDTPPFPSAARPKLTFSDDLTLEFNGDRIELRHVTPLAHTEGDTILFFRKANVLVTGDLFSNHFYPGFDVDRGGNIDGVIRAQTAMIEMIDDKTRVIPGHGPLASRDDLRVSRDMLIQIRDRVAKLVQAGKSEAEVIAAAPTQDYDRTWRTGGIQITAFVKELYADARRRQGVPRL